MLNSNSKVFITGCGGMLGEAVYKEFKDRYWVFATDIDLNEPWLSFLDVADAGTVKRMLSEKTPDCIIHLAALTDMEYCEKNSRESYAVNTGGVGNLGFYAHENNIPFVYISTAGIFDGKKDSYIEDDKPNPLSVYGRSKYLGELAARAVDNHIVLRAGWMMGSGPSKDKKFVNKLIKQIRSGAKELFVVDDLIGTPCYTYDLAKSLRQLLEAGEVGVFHGACSGGGTRYDVAKHIVDVLGLSDKIVVTPVKSSRFESEYFAPRPRSEQLVNTKKDGVSPVVTRDWKVCVEEYINKFNWNL